MTEDGMEALKRPIPDDDERGHDVSDRLLDAAPHDEDLLREEVELILEVPLLLLHDGLQPSRSGP